MIRNIQALRALAALLVVYVHMDICVKLLHLPLFGWQGVDLFFVISGLVMVFATKARSQTSLSFILNRIARVVPIYWLATILVFIIAIIHPNLLKSTTSSVADLVRSLLFIPYQKNNGIFAPVLFVGWTLNYEMFFYFLFSIGLIIRNYEVGILFSIASLIILSLIGILLRPGNTIIGFYTNARILEFGLGMLIGLVLTYAERYLCKVPLSGVCVVGVAALAILIAAPIMWPFAPPVITAGLPAMVVVACAVLAERRDLALKSAAILAVGDASYALYLSHPYLTVSVQKLATKFEAWPAAVVVVAISTVIAALITAVVLHLFVERPLSAWTRQFLSRRIAGDAGRTTA